MKQPNTASKRDGAGQDVSGIVADQLVYLLARAAGQVSAGLHRKIRAYGLSVPEYRSMMTLADGPRAVGNLAELLLMKQPTLTRILERLEGTGQVRRLPDSADGRKVLAILTPAGQRLVSDLTPLSLDHDAEILSGYTDEDAATLKDALRVLISRTSDQ